MQICPNCEHENPDDVPVCLNCASTLQNTCLNCGARVPRENRFCGQCGERQDESSLVQPAKNPKLAAHEKMLSSLQANIPSAMVNKITRSAPELVGQRREVTVLFVSIANFHRLSKVLDSEEVYLVVDEVMAELAEVVYKYEGTIDKFSGSGLMALFGIPINHENDPERAVRAALDMIAGMETIRERFRDRYDFDINLQAGINTGPVIAGSLIGNHHMEYTIIGDTVNMASRLEALAEPGTSLVSIQTYQRTRPIINFKSMASLPGNGGSEPISAYQVLDIRVKPGQIRGLPGLQVPVVGRLDDIARLVCWFQRVCDQNTSAVALCSGDAGIGKTRLVSEFSQEVDPDKISIFKGTCAAYMRITPYRVVADLIRNMIAVSEVDSETFQQDALFQYLEAHQLTDPDALPYLYHVLGLPQPDHILDARMRLLAPDMLQRQTQSVLRKFFIGRVEKSPVVLIFDDLHWVDQASRDFFVYFCQSISNLPIFVIFVARDFQRDKMLQPLVDMVRKETVHALEIHLHPLDIADSRLLADQLIQGTTDDASELKQQMIERAKGNPYFTEEMVRVLIDQGGIIRKNGEWQVTSKAMDLIQNVPGTLQDIILARFDRLPPGSRILLQKAAVLGQSFPIPLLRTFSRESTEAFEDTLDSLLKRDYLVRGKFESEDGFDFKHPLLQAVIYDTLLNKDLQRLHFSLGEIIASGGYWLPSEQDEILAYHYGRSDKPEKAVPYLLASAEKAAQRYANESVIQHYRRVIQILDGMDQLQGKDIQRARIGLGQALKFTGEFDEAVSVLESALGSENQEDSIHETGHDVAVLADALRELGDIRAREGSLDLAETLLKQGLELLGDGGEVQFPTHWRRLVDRLAWVYFRQGKLEYAFNQADLALYDLETWEVDDPITLASLSNTLGGIYWTRSRNEDAITNVERSLKIYQSLNYAWGTAIAYTNLGVLHFSMGKWPQAVANFEQADSIQSEFGYILERPTNLKNLGEVLISIGDHERAREVLELGRTVAQHLGMNIAEVYIEIGLCRLAVVQGNPFQAGQHLKNIQKLLAPSGDQVNERFAQMLSLSAQVEVLNGNLEDGVKQAEKALQISEQGGFVTEKAEGLRVLGLINTELGNFPIGESNLLACLDTAISQKDSYRQAKALAGLSRLYLAWGGLRHPSPDNPNQKARAAIHQALSLFDMLGAKFDLHQARVIRNQIDKKDRNLGTGDLQEDQIDKMRLQLGMPDGEWYQAVILYIQLVPASDADIEFVFETITIFIPPLLEIFEEHGGHTIRHQDGMTVIFGAPTAFEDDPERCIQAAIKVVNFYQEFYKHTELPVSIRLGVSMGRVVAGFVGSAVEQEFIAAGEPVVEARAVAQVAPLSRVWVTAPVRNATTYRFEYSAMPEELTTNLAGTSVHQLDGIREQIRPVRGLMGLKAPFVGRGPEMEALADFSQRLEEGNGGLIWIEGDPGIGKSRLMREFAASLLSKGITFWSGTCTVRRADHAFSLFSDVLSNAFDMQPTYPVEQIYTLIDQKLEAWSNELADLRPYIQLLSGVQPTGKSGELLLNLDPEQLRRQTFVAIRKLIEVVSSQQPLVLIVDDIQWIDPVSADLLFFLTSLILEHPVLIVGARRKGDGSKAEQTLDQIQKLHLDKTRHLSIQPLTTPECNQLLDQFFSTADIAESVNELIVQQSGGNPYFIEEFIRMLVEQDYVQVIRGQLEVNQAFEIDSLSIPSSLETLIRARVDALQNPVRNMLQVASVIGQRFHRSLLEVVSGQKGVDQRLDLLQNRGMLQPTSEDGYWEFSHSLIETVVYNTVLKAQRKVLHHRAAAALESQWYGSEAEHAEDLAYHFQRAEEHDKALHYLVIAGERSALRYANQAALDYFEDAANLISQLPGTEDDFRFRVALGLGEVYQFVGNFEASFQVLSDEIARGDGGALSSIQKAKLYRCLGGTVLKQGDFGGAIPHFDRGLETLGTPLGKVEQAEAAMLLERKGWTYYLEVRLEESKDTAVDAHHYASLAADLQALAKIETLLGGGFYRQGETDTAVVHVEKAMGYWREMGYTWGVAASLSNLGILEVSAGNWDAALDYFQRSLDLRREIGDVEGVVIAYNNLGMLANEKGDMALAETHYRNCLAVARPFRIAWQTANATMGLAQALLYQGNIQDAQEMLQDGIDLADGIGARDLSSEMGRTQAEIMLAKGEIGAALETARKAAVLANEINDFLLESVAWRIVSECRLRDDQPEESLATLENAWQALEKANDEVETGRVNAQAGKIFVALGELDVAEGYLGKAETIFSRLGAARDLENLEAIRKS